MDEFKKADIAHSSISERLKSSPIILRKHPTRILHPIPQEPIHGNILEPDKLTLSLLERIWSRKYLTGEMPPPDDIEMYYRKKWFDGVHHELLMDIMQSGRVPLGWKEHWTLDCPPTTFDALAFAKKIGYSVPDDFLKEKKISYSEEEAFYAAYMIVSNNFYFWEDHTPSNNWRSFVCQLSGQFLVPDPIMKSKTPYILDQLWIVSDTNSQVRLIGLEIDGENHLNDENKKKDEKRDVMLAAMGYEIYHVAGWWCRIDPYRVICDFLSSCGIFPDAEKYIIGQKLKSISDYVCELCGRPMVRWDVDWIHEVEKEGKYILAHRDCAQEYD